MAMLNHPSRLAVIFDLSERIASARTILGLHSLMISLAGGDLQPGPLFLLIAVAQALEDFQGRPGSRLGDPRQARRPGEGRDLEPLFQHHLAVLTAAAAEVEDMGAGRQGR